MPTDSVILLTAPGTAAIAVVRLVGSRVNDFAAAHLSRLLPLQKCVYCNWIDHNQIIDDVVAVRVADDIIDINLHGGAWVVQRAVEIAERFGFHRVAWDDPLNAFNKAFDADDDIERQMQIDLPRATTHEAMLLLLTQPQAWRAMLLSRDAQAMRRAIDDTALERLLTEPTVAIVGKPNVGKSTLANRLFQRDHSIVADLPGTTRDWVGERANVDGLMVRLVDTPGLRHTSDVIEAAAIERARPVIASADLIVRVWDATDASIDLDTVSKDEINVINKADLGPLVIPGAIATVGLTGHGVDALRTTIRLRLGCAEIASAHARCWTTEQRTQLQVVIEAKENCRQS